jgi:DNA repair exonuclease SbcCD nuclease subunit
MKIAIISDTHYGARKNSKLFHDYFEEFYQNIFFPTLDERGIQHVIHMGDCFDSRKGIDFSALQWSKRVVFEPLKERGIEMHLIAGNHDAYYKNTNAVNSVELLLGEYDNVHVYSEAAEATVADLNVLLVPWINSENEASTTKIIEKTSCKCALGHLELNGFRVNRQIVMDHGLESSIFEKFEKVFSGHYHTRSTDGRIFYLGNPYEMYWTDVNDLRGFTIFDTETLEHEYVDNPYKMFYSITYNDTDYQLFDASPYVNKIVKVVVKNKSNTLKFEKFIDKLYSVGVADLKIVENFDFSGWYDKETDEVIQSEDTLSILDRYIEESETELDKSRIQSLIREIYQEACELV